MDTDALGDLVLKNDDLLISFTNGTLALLDLCLACHTQSLSADELVAKLPDLADNSFILLVHRSFLPARKHDDKVELSYPLLCSSFRLHFAQGLEEVVVLITLPLMHKL